MRRTLSARGAVAVLLCVLLPFAVYWQMLLPGRAPQDYDVFNYFVPLRTYLVDAWHHGRLIPLWDPELFMGVPFFANIQQAVLYPGSLLFLLASVPHALAWSLVIHLAVAGAGALAYARKAERLGWLAAALVGVVYTLGGLMNGQMGHLNQEEALAWTPWLMLAVDRFWIRQTYARAGLISLLVAVSILAGHTQQSYYAILWVGVVTLRRAWIQQRERGWPSLVRPVAAEAAAGALGLLVTSVQVLATLDLTRYSIRSGGLSLQVAGAGALPLHGVLQNLLPDYTFQQDPEFAYWVGMSTLALAALALVRHRRPWLVILGALALASAWAAVGPNAGLYTLLFHLLPGYDLFRVPSRILGIAYFAIAILAGHGLQTVTQLASPAIGRLHRRPAALGLAGLLAVMPPVVIALVRLTHAQGAVQRDLGFESGHLAAAQAAFALGAVALIWLAMFSPRFLARLSPPALLVLVTAELILAGGPTEMRNSVPYSLYTTPSSSLKLARPSLNTRVLPLGRAVYTLPVPAGLNPLQARAYEQYELMNDILYPNRVSGTGVLDADGYDGSVLPLKSYVAYRQAVLPPGSSNIPDFTITALTGTVWSLQWLRQSGISEVVATVGWNPNPPGCGPCLQPGPVSGHLRLWTVPGPEPTRAYLLEGSSRVPATITSDTGERVVVRLPAGASGTLVLADSYFPGWTAAVDGRPAVIKEYLGMFRAVSVPEGARTVVFDYQPRWLGPGLAVSLAALLVTLLLLLTPVLGWLRRRGHLSMR